MELLVCRCLLIVAIEGESTLELSIEEVINRIRVPTGSDVTFTILRGNSETFDITITRAKIEIPTVIHTMIDNNIGYIIITQFTPKTNERVKEAIADFQDNNYESLIIDVRSNPGGLLSSVVDVSDIFMDRGQLIVSTKSRIRSENNTFYAKRKANVSEDIPIIVLIDKYSASAAEILTGVLKDTDRAYIMGETSYGKGSVQQILPISLGSVKLTISKYYTPSDISIDKIGIEPDQEVKIEEYSDEEIQSYKKMKEGELIENFIKNHPKPSEKNISAFILSLKNDGIILRDERIRKEIRDELNRFNNSPPIYDLEYDIVLKEAVNLLNGEGIPK